MKITIESTTRVVEVNGVEARIWEGRTESGIPVVCMITRVAVPAAQDCTQFERELSERREPTDLGRAIPARMIF